MYIRNEMDVSYVRALHASPDAPAVDIYVNNNLVFEDLKFGDFTKYVPLMMGTYQISVYPQGDTENPVLTVDVEVPEREVITIAAANFLSDLELVPYIESNPKDLGEGMSRIRAIHLSPDAPNVDVLVDGNVVFSDLEFLEATDYVEVMSKDYTIDINVAGTDTTVLELTPTLKSKRVYSVYVIGTVDDLMAVQSLDGSTYIRY